MFKQNTVFILGAAMSNEVGLPLSGDLMTEIANVLPYENTGNDVVRGVLFQSSESQRNNIDACRAIRAALPRAASIDNLIEHRGHDLAFKHCAKVGIVASILLAEARSDLQSKRDRPRGQINADSSTYAALFRTIVGNVAALGIEEALSGVTFINFNYDRCLEHYMADWLIAYSGITPAAAERLVDSVRIVRPYGSVGKLPRAQGGQTDVQFGAKLHQVDLSGLAGNILTFSEERGSETDLAVHDAMTNASQLIFLGCAFHPQNIRLLRPPHHSKFVEVYGTCYMVPPQDDYSSPTLQSFTEPTRVAFENAIDSWPRSISLGSARRILFEPLTCRQLVAKYAAEWVAA